MINVKTIVAGTPPTVAPAIVEVREVGEGFDVVQA
jgi:hypothetical protein